ncbi:MAG: copper-translocating P-type ATPase, partial [Alphaproteobacteria bacterium]|nr:copper-translocating P-type ATPase [Alphaproteobacteria bacterium]
MATGCDGLSDGVPSAPTSGCHDTGPGCHDPDDRIDFLKRAKIAAVFTVPLVALVMGMHVFDVPVTRFFTPQQFQFLQLFLATPVVVWCAAPFFQRGWQSVRNRSANMWTLISLGVATAFVYSAVATLVPDLFPVEVQAGDGTIPVYFESAAAIVLLVLIGQLLETNARDKAEGAIRSLLDLSPKTALLLDAHGQEHVVVAADVLSGQNLVIKPGAAIPVDGIVIDGQSAVDESLLTGEAHPVAKHAGDPITSGTLNTTGRMVMRATHTGSDTTMARIIALVENAQQSRPPIQHLADQVARWFVPVVIAIAGLAFVAWWGLGPVPSLGYAVVAAVSVLIIACPCAIGLAAPISVRVATGRGARAGILIKNAEALQALAECDTVVFDKTGTLTEGKPQICEIRPATGFSQDQVLAYAASLEKASEHPLALAIVSAAQERRITPRPISNFAAVIGEGVTGKANGTQLVAGTAKLLQRLGVVVPPSVVDTGAPAETSAGTTHIFIAQDDTYVGRIALSDPVRSGAAHAVRMLQSRGIETIMATGDGQSAADAVARRLGITHVHAGVLPEDKAAIVADLKARNRKVAVAGDGINDAPALAQADVGIAMGRGADVAIESAGITLLNS